MLSMIFGAVGFLLAAFAVIGNDSAQTLGTFISSNKKKTDWRLMWVFTSVILGATLMYGWGQGDIAFGRLNKIPLPEQFQWYHAAAPMLLLGLTRFGVPVSTTLLTLSAFSSGLVLEKIIMKSALGYAVAALAAYSIWMVLTRFFNEKSPVKEDHKRYWTIAQWCSTGFLWHMWLSHDIANIFVYLPREGVSLPAMLGIIGILVIGLAHLFYTEGGKIQEIVLSKSGTRFIRSACLIDLFYALVLWYFKVYNDIPMSTTWVFIGLLAGRELAVYRTFNRDKKIEVIFPMLVKDFLKIMLGLALSVAVVSGVIYFDSM
jgi:phosphate/sulfate permease